MWWKGWGWFGSGCGGGGTGVASGCASDGGDCVLLARESSSPTDTDADASSKSRKHSDPPARPNPSPLSPDDKEVFNISQNVYDYEQASAVCEALDARLATPNEVRAAYENGADWCNYGWTEGKYALYPTQRATWDKLQSSPEHAHDCGLPGVNGGYFGNTALQFGVNCYGKKPEPRQGEMGLQYAEYSDYLSAEQLRHQQRIEKVKATLDDVRILPFNRNRWDCNRTMRERMHDAVANEQSPPATASQAKAKGNDRSESSGSQGV